MPKVGYIFYLIVICLLGTEALWRVKKYQEIQSKLEQHQEFILAFGGGRWFPDRDAGWRYVPNYEQIVDREIEPIKWRTNSYGHVSGDEYPIQKPENEYRIAVLGDSFTASVGTTVRWTSLLEGLLNSNQEWLNFVNGRKTRVINFGRDLMGITQMERVYSTEANEFEPDIVIVNVISDDIYRKSFLRGIHLAVEPDVREQMAFERTMKGAERDWYVLWPEFIADVFGKSLGIAPKISTELGNVPRFSSIDAALETAISALEKIKQVHNETIVIHHPMRWDIPPSFPPNDQQEAREGLLLNPRISVVPAVEYYPVPTMNAEEWEVITKPWFLLDGHNSDEGNRIHAIAVHQILSSRYLAD